jgi:hypothetical protein
MMTSLADPFTVFILDCGERVGFAIERTLTIMDLMDAARRCFKTPFSLMHNGAVVDNTRQVSYYGENPVFHLIQREKHGRDETVETETVAMAAKHSKQ